jgi:DNA-binding transcriptional MerR regulator
MFPAEGARSGAGQQVFFSSDVSQMAGVTLRQLQWWDERKLVTPRKKDHRRLYTPRQVLEILTAGELRRKGLSLQKIRRVLRSLRRELNHRFGEDLEYSHRLFVLTDGQLLFLEEKPERVLARLAEAPNAMCLICLSDLIHRILSRDVLRISTRQLSLF